MLKVALTLASLIVSALPVTAETNDIVHIGGSFKNSCGIMALLHLDDQSVQIVGKDDNGEYISLERVTVQELADRSSHLTNYLNRPLIFRQGHIEVKKSGGASNRGSCPSGPGWMSINDVRQKYNECFSGYEMAKNFGFEYEGCKF